ncbi:MAG: M56 family metallopeptidase [Pirellulaceae bacterium]
MNAADVWTHTLFNGTLRVLCAAFVASLVLRTLRPSTARSHRLVWMAVLLQGVIVSPFVVPLPVWEPVGRTPSVDEAMDAFSEASIPTAVDASSTLHDATARTGGNDHSWRRIFLTVWLIGLAGLLAFGVASQAIVQSILRRSVPARLQWQRQLQELMETHANGRRATLVVTERLGPLLAVSRSGYRIAVPRRTWSQLSVSQREAVLLHELAHLQRYDLWLSMFVRLLAAVHWFNPVAWWAAAKFDEAAEWACDGRVAQERPALATDLATALLSIADSRPRLVAGVVSVRGSRISHRVRRLLCPLETKESVMKKLLIGGLVLALVTTGIVRVQLVAREGDVAALNENANVYINDLLRTLEPSDDPLQQRLVAALRSRGGQIVLADQVERSSQEASAGDSGDVLSALLNEHFQVEQDEASLRPGSERLRERLISAAASTGSDIQQIQTACRNIADRLQGTDEATLLLQRFLREDAGPVMLYLKHLRNHMQPDMAMMTGPFGKVLAQHSDGSLRVRPDAREEVAKRIEQRSQAVALLNRLSTAMSDWGQSLAGTDPLHKRMKQRLSEPTFAARFVAEALFSKNDLSRIRVNEVLDQLDDLTIDTAKGIELHPEARDEVQRVLDEFDVIYSRLESLRPTLAKLHQQLDLSDPTTRGFSELLDTDFGRLAAAEAAEPVGRSAEELLLGMLAEAIDQSGDKIELAVDGEKRNELVEGIQKAFREFRQAQRKSRSIKDIAEMIDDKPLAEAMQSVGGLLVFKSLADERAETVKLAGYEEWASRLFERNGDHRVIRDTARPAVEALLAEIDHVEAELEKDDF